MSGRELNGRGVGWGDLQVAGQREGHHLEVAMGSGMKGCLTLGSFPRKRIVQTSPLSSPFADVRFKRAESVGHVVETMLGAICMEPGKYVRQLQAWTAMGFLEADLRNAQGRSQSRGA